MSLSSTSITRLWSSVEDGGSCIKIGETFISRNRRAKSYRSMDIANGEDKAQGSSGGSLAARLHCRKIRTSSGSKDPVTECSTP